MWQVRKGVCEQCCYVMGPGAILQRQESRTIIVSKGLKNTKFDSYVLAVNPPSPTLQASSLLRHLTQNGEWCLYHS